MKANLLRALAPLLMLLPCGPAPAQMDGPPRERGGYGRHGPSDPARPNEAAPYLRDLFPSTYKPLPRADTLIVHATILDGAGHRIDDGQILLHDGKVAAIGHELDGKGARQIDAHGRWVTPGIIDVHSHDGTYVVPLTAADANASDVSEMSDPNAAGTWIESAVNPQDPAFAKALASGVTTLQILPGSSPIFGGRSVILHPIPATTMQAMKMPGAPWGMKMACGENPKGTDVEKGRGPTSRQGEIQFIRQAFAKARHYMHEWDEYLTGKEDDDPPTDDPQLDTLAAVLNGDIAVQMHCYRSDEMATMLDLSHAIGFRIAAFHHAVEAYKIAPLLAANQVCAAVWSDWWGFKMEALDAIRENAAFVDAAPGGCAMMHSDSPVLGQRLNVEAGKAAAAGRRAGLSLPPEHVIAWVTANPAKAMGIADRVGSLEPGKDADAVIWSADPFSVYAHADIVFVDGAIAFDRSDPARQPRPDFEIGRAPEPRR
ncbi:amidohydrolase family protein [Flavisphingomonas formosensis]|uniref:amidohydrolase family protein n=1 Tax=Flavisphingomonas formosensis TaxID=861534 RepID=UPI0018E05996|nr:amidohydrolase family protein [Sphingomonas formosensis]